MFVQKIAGLDKTSFKKRLDIRCNTKNIAKAKEVKKKIIKNINQDERVK